MPYIAVKSERQEVDHRDLNEPMVIGRAPDCDIQIRDILLSRHHCKIDFSDAGWQVSDLNSKNGTVLNGQTLLATTLLKDCDVLRVGRSKIVFHEGVLDPEIRKRAPAPTRAADPSEALAGTMAGFTLIMPGEAETPPPGNMPNPQPRPKEPASYEKPEVRELLSAIASSSWDSIYAEATKQPANLAVSPATPEEPRRGPRARPKSPVDLSLQVKPPPRPMPKAVESRVADMLHVSQEDALQVEDVLAVEEAARTTVVAPAPPIVPQRSKRSWNIRISRDEMRRPLSWVVLAIWIAAAATLVTWWTTRSDGSAVAPKTPTIVNSPDNSPGQSAVQPVPAAVPFVPTSLKSNPSIHAAAEAAAINAPIWMW
jgi:pSer/pThr/pTyr-binding forkhead associated (FHA) protein